MIGLIDAAGGVVDQRQVQLEEHAEALDARKRAQRFDRLHRIAETELDPRFGEFKSHLWNELRNATREAELAEARRQI